MTDEDKSSHAVFGPGGCWSVLAPNQSTECPEGGVLNKTELLRHKQFIGGLIGVKSKYTVL